MANFGRAVHANLNRFACRYSWNLTFNQIVSMTKLPLPS
jgi:hypothetical protein